MALLACVFSPILRSGQSFKISESRTELSTVNSSNLESVSEEIIFAQISVYLDFWFIHTTSAEKECDVIIWTLEKL